MKVGAFLDFRFSAMAYFYFLRIVYKNSTLVLFSLGSFAGKAEWLDKGHRKCLILWRTITEWANVLLDFVSEDLLTFDFVLCRVLLAGIVGLCLLI